MFGLFFVLCLEKPAFMKRLLQVFGLITMSIFSSCKKDNPEPPAGVKMDYVVKCRYCEVKYLNPKGDTSQTVIQHNVSTEQVLSDYYQPNDTMMIILNSLDTSDLVDEMLLSIRKNGQSTNLKSAAAIYPVVKIFSIWAIVPN